MATRQVYVAGGNGIGYTYEVDSPSDYASIPNNTYFKDLSLGVGGLIMYKSGTGELLSIYSSGGGTVTKIKRQTVRYVDPVSGNDTTAQANYTDNNFIYPYLNYSTALSDAVSGDWIIMLPGTYTGAMFLKNGVTIYCEPGVNITNGGFICDSAMTSGVLGYAKFTGTSSYTAFDVYANSGSYTADLTFEFDSITGTRTYGINHNCNGTLTVRGNSIFCGRPFRISSNTKNVNINIKNFIKGYDTFVLMFGIYFGGAPYPKMIGEIIVTCPLIESTTASNYRTLINFGEALRWSDPGAYRIIIDTKVIKSSQNSISEPYPYYSGVVFIGGGDNCHVYGDILGNTIHCVSNPSLSATYHTGTIYFYGNMESNIPVISCGTKSANGNGWHNLSINDGYLKTKGTAGLGLVETTNNWNSIHGGTPGVLYFKDCILYNETVDSNVLQLNQPFSKAFLYNCMVYSRGATGFAATSVQASKTVNYVNTISNKPNGATITSELTSSSFMYESALDIPKNNL
jgi:hypothetical protein